MADDKWLLFQEAVAYATRKTGLPDAEALLKCELVRDRIRHRYPGEPPFPLYPAVVLAEIHPGDLHNWVDAICGGRPFDRSKARNPGGRPPKADWSAFEDRFRDECNKRGNPDSLNVRGWQTQADVATWLGDLAEREDTPVGETQLRQHAREFIDRMRSET